ncbi:phytoene/squalene synthase family protein [Cryobacterium adonitolivorans]|uniref:Phytoene/squalene synthase family protein n=1 Tax=Cryobacterium adonitolivorans TaxID=1259189 RepID=A0A4R8W8F4_9MICO|nr:phytoene/squalene synthase family protein [Cryobacterium adonitolivorans]TFC02788.1 phytoene/squalene synthase family protein [Cryobacterium adonitolivorans]
MSRDTAGPLVGPGITGLDSYNAAALASATTVIAQYSTSFGLAARLLAPGLRDEVRSIYALVRIADEIVDGAAAGAGIDLAGQRELLDDLEHETERAMTRGFSTNLVVHAFAVTARRVGIDPILTRPFYASMRRDLDPAPFTPASVAEYIYGSAEVVGLMCLRSFLHESPRSPRNQAVLEHGARSLGAAFQKVNFLRDLAADRDALGRNYFPGVDLARLTDGQKNLLLDNVDADLEAAARVLPMLPSGSRRAVTAAHRLFARLSAKLRETPAQSLMSTRVRVPDPEKLMIALSSSLGPQAWRR